MSKSGLKVVCNFWELSRLCPETSMKLHVHEFVFGNGNSGVHYIKRADVFVALKNVKEYRFSAVVWSGATFKSCSNVCSVYFHVYLYCSRIHECTFSLRFLGIILRVLRIEVSFRIQCLHYKPVSNHFCSRGQGGVKSISRGNCYCNEENS